jgi:hypothetical protein
MNVGKNDFIPTEQIIWFEEDMKERDLSDYYEER